MRLKCEDYGSIVVLTGAGVSVASGLQPYRGPGGLWEEHGGEDALTAETLARDPSRVWAVLGPVRHQVRQARPNPAHVALAKLEARLAGRVTLITQNIDGLHQMAGSRDPIELHGSIHRSRCSDPDCRQESGLDELCQPHLCPVCGKAMRPDVVLFGEPIPGGEEWRAKRALRTVELFVAVGTSGLVSPASHFVRSANYAGARTVLVNLTPAPESGFGEQYLGKAEELLPVLLA